MKCPKCEIEMFCRPIFLDGNRIANFECKNKQCEKYIPDADAPAQPPLGITQDLEQDES